MKIEILKLKDLKEPKKNVRVHTKLQLEELQKSVDMFGQTRPIVIDEKNIILCGNGLYQALRAMKVENVSAYRVTNLSENQKKKLMIADNKTFSLGIDDLDVITEFINDLKDDLVIPGYDEEILQSMVMEAEEVTETLNDFGVLNEADLNKMKAQGERKEEIINSHIKEVAPVQNNSVNEPPIGFIGDKGPQGERGYQSQPDPNNDVISYEVKEEIKGEVKKTVVCPKCGEIICI